MKQQCDNHPEVALKITQLSALVFVNVENIIETLELLAEQNHFVEEEVVANHFKNTAVFKKSIEMSVNSPTTNN